MRNLEDALIAALREPRRNQMAGWGRAFEEHRGHPSFRTEGWAFSREVGFVCGCSGCDQEWRINISLLRDMIPRAREQYMQMRRRALYTLGTTGKERRAERRALSRARALLHGALTKAQRWELRATKAFTIQGKDKKTYLITEGGSLNVRLIQGGVATHALCVVADHKHPVPVYDLMLTQKLMLETNPEAFWKIANVTPLTAVAELRADQPPRMLPPPLEIADEDLDDPTQWINERLYAAG